MTSVSSTTDGNLERRPLDAHGFQLRADAQLFACLAHQGKRDLLESWSKQAPQAEVGAEFQFQFAAAMAKQGDTDGALSRLREVLAANPGHAKARSLAYRLILQRAQMVAREGNWQILSDLVTEALQFCPEGENPESDFARYKGALTASHLRNGKRQEPAQLWERQLLENPQDSSVVHNLALLHYWWARSAETTSNGTSVANHWRQAIIYWSLLEQMDAFWCAWREGRKKVWGFDLVDEEAKDLRKRVFEQRFYHDFHNRLDDAKQKNQRALAQQYEECLNSALLERKSAQCWKQALALFAEAGMSGISWLQQPAAKTGSVPGKPATANPPTNLLGLPGGVGFFGKFGLIPQIQQAAARLSLVKGSQECAAHLVILFSPRGIGHAFILAEERGLPAEGIGMLDQLPAGAQASKEAVYVRILALRARGEQLLGRTSFSEAFECWKSAYDKAGLGSGKNSPAPLTNGPNSADAATLDRLFDPMLLSLRSSIQDEVVAAAMKEVKRLKTAEKLDDSIAVLEKARQIDKDGILLEHLCVCLCERASEGIGGNRLNDARKDFARVLQLKPANDRAKRGMGTICNNEGCAEKDPQKSIALFEKGMEWDPNSHALKSNLAIELTNLAISRINASTNYTKREAVDKAIPLLERAFNIASPAANLKADALSTIRSRAEVDSNAGAMYARGIDDDTTKHVVEALATAYFMRARARRGY